MSTIQLALASRIFLMFATALATAVGTFLATSYPSVYSALCVA